MSSSTVYRAYLDRHELVSGGTAAPNWIEDGRAFWVAEGAPEDTVILRVDTNTGMARPMFDVASIRGALSAATGHPPPYLGLPFETFERLDNDKVTFRYEGSTWLLDPATNTVKRLTGTDALQDLQQMLGWTGSGRLQPRMWVRSDYLVDHLEVPEQLSPSGEWFAAVRDHNIVLRSIRDDRHKTLTTDGTPDRFWDIESLRWRGLPGLRVTFRAVSPWSPDSVTLLAYRRDVTGVFRIPRMNWLQPFEEVSVAPYQKAGARLDRVEPAFVDLRNGRQTTVMLESVDDRYIQLLGWQSDASEALIIVYARDFKRIDIVAAARETGAIRTLLTETSETPLKIQHEAMFSGEHGFRLLPGGGFLWLSSRDGWNHVYHYDRRGTLIGRLTSGDWPVYDIEHIGTDGFVYFTGAVDLTRPYDVHVCRVALGGGPIEQLTREKGIHGPTFSPGGHAFLDTHSSVDRPVRTDLVKADGTRLRILSDMDITRLTAVGYMPVEEFTVKAADHATDLWGVMYKPYDFDPKQSYPVIQCSYAGPQSIESRRFFAIDQARSKNMPWALAQLGYIVVCLDARGTPGRSKAFHDAVSGDWSPAILDNAVGVRHLCERHRWMDANRVGIIGHSWAGYFATYALADAPDIYHAAAACSPGYDPWHLMISEPYLGLPQQNRDNYDRANLSGFVRRIKGRLLIVAGTSDDAVMSPAMKMVRSLIDANIDHEFVPVPQAFHHFAGADEDYLLQKIVGWFDRHVKNRQGTP